MCPFMGLFATYLAQCGDQAGTTAGLAAINRYGASVNTPAGIALDDNTDLMARHRAYTGVTDSSDGLAKGSVIASSRNNASAVAGRVA